MALIKIEMSMPPVDGMDIKFKAPCDCTQITGLLAEYPGGSKEFTFRDCHGNNLAGIGNLFGEGAYVKVIIDSNKGYAYLQNADNNSFLNSAVFGTYTHSGNNLTGYGENGKFKATTTGTISTINVNGVTCSIRCGDESSIDLITGSWYTFILDGNTVNFNAGGAGASLNFKIVGGTAQPVSPSENMIWVNTDTEIRGWQFGVDNPNLLDFTTWANVIGVQNGTKSVSGNSVTLTANASGDCYTGFDPTSEAKISCTPGKTYILQWDHSGSVGYVYAFPNADIPGLVMASAASGYLEYTAGADVPFFTFRIGVHEANTSATYSNIRITEKDRAFSPGSVWITTGTTSSVEFNALKKNNIQVYPSMCCQFSNGTWNSMNAFIYQRGNWVQFSATFAATLNVTYPAGSTLTCTNGSVTLTASSTNGSYTFTVPSAGTWTVTVTNGVESASDTVTITASGESKSIELRYFPEYWYHYEGHGWNTEMGSYSQWGSGSTVGTDEISIPVKFAGGEPTKVGVYQTTAFDVTNFQKLKFEYKSDIYSSGTSSCGVFIGIGNTSGDWPASNWDAQMIFREAVSDWTAYEIDISSVNKSSRLRLMVWAEKGTTAHIRNITLE